MSGIPSLPGEKGQTSLFHREHQHEYFYHRGALLLSGKKTFIFWIRPSSMKKLLDWIRDELGLVRLLPEAL